MKSRAGIVSFVLCLAVTLAFELGGASAFADDATDGLAAGANPQAQIRRRKALRRKTPPRRKR